MISFVSNCTLGLQLTFTGIGSRDASILSYIKQKGITAIATHDEDFTLVDFVKIDDLLKNEICEK